MDQATKTRIAAEQLARLKSLRRGVVPPGLLEQHTVEDTVADAQLKYVSHIVDSLQLFFPVYCHYRRPSTKKLLALFPELALATDHFLNLDTMFETLLADALRLARADAWHDLLLIERGIAKSRIAPRVDASRSVLARRLRAARPVPSRLVDRGGVFFVWVTTDLVTAFGYPGRDPRRAKPIKRMACAIYRRPRTDQPEIIWHRAAGR